MRTKRTGAVAPALCAVLICGVSSACTDDVPDDASPTPSASPSSSAETPDETAAADGPFDCTLVSAAQQELNDASGAELSRLGIDRDDPRAFSVVVLVASQQAAEYWQAIEEAATPALEQELADDVRLVTGYWTAIDAEIDAIEIADSSEVEVQAAANELVELSNEHPQDDLAPAQQRIQDVLAGNCGTEPAPSASP